MPPENEEPQNDDATQDAPPAGDADQQPDDYAELKAAIAKERDASKAAKAELRKMTAKLAEMENAGKPDLERVTAERDQLRADYDALSSKVQDASGREAVRKSAKALGAPDPDLIYRMVRSDIEYEAGEPVNTDDIVKQAKADAPQLFKAVTAGADAGAGNAGTRSANSDWLRAAIQARR